MKKYIIFAILLISLPSYSYVINTDNKPTKAHSCKITQSTATDPLPKQNFKDNDLTTRTGKLEDPLVNRIILFGRIRDKNCLPITNAEVTIWQNDQFGIARYIPSYNLDNNIYSEFKATGSHGTNNQGEVAFVTVTPTKKQGQKANINIIVKHPNYPELKTQITLLDLNQTHVKNSKVLAREGKNDKLKYPVYYFDIILDGIEKHLQS